MSFWLDKPSILIDKHAIKELWLDNTHGLDRKLNAITRIVILLTFAGFILTRNYNIFVTSIITLIVVVIVHRIKKHENIKDDINKLTEGFKIKIDEKYVKPTKNNPMMNVLLPEIKYDRNREAGNPAFVESVNKEIKKNVRKIGIDSKMFSDLGENVLFEREMELSDSMKRFYTTANSRVENDQRAFANFCYKNTAACKDGISVNCNK